MGMLRLLVIILLLANGGYFAWSQGYLAPLGFAPMVQTEPERLRSQIQPEAITLLSSGETQRRLDAVAAANASECLESTVLSNAQADNLRTSLAALPEDSWKLESIDKPGRWLVYMGPYSSADSLAKKKIELTRINVSFEDPPSTNWANGLSLGTYSDKNEAQQARTQLLNRGARSARVVEDVAPVQGKVLRLPTVTQALRAQLTPVNAALGIAALHVCGH
jgi:hypothetical protein